MPSSRLPTAKSSTSFRPPSRRRPPAPVARREARRAINGLSITNQHRTRVRLAATPGLLWQDEGVGQLLRHKLMQRRFPLESSPSETQITPMNLLSLANRCDRLIVLIAQDFGRLPGSLRATARRNTSRWSGAGADKVTTLLVQPTGSAEDPLGFDPAVTEALAEHLAREWPRPERLGCQLPAQELNVLGKPQGTLPCG